MLRARRAAALTGVNAASLTDGGGHCLPEPARNQQCLHLPCPPTHRHPNNLFYIVHTLQPGLRDILLVLKDALPGSGPSSLKEALLKGDDGKGKLREVADGRAAGRGNAHLSSGPRSIDGASSAPRRKA